MVKALRRASVFLTIFGALMYSPISFGRLREDDQALFRRYGTPVRKAAPWSRFVPTVYVFEKNGFRITAGLADVGQSERRTKECWLLLFQKLDRADFSKTEISTLLDANAPAAKWEQTSQTAEGTEWRNPGQAMARYDSTKNLLMIVRVELLVMDKFMEQKEAKQRLKDF